MSVWLCGVRPPWRQFAPSFDSRPNVTIGPTAEELRVVIREELVKALAEHFKRERRASHRAKRAAPLAQPKDRK